MIENSQCLLEKHKHGITVTVNLEILVISMRENDICIKYLYHDLFNNESSILENT